MKKLFHFILSSNRKRRDMAVFFVLWVLRQVRDVEKDEMDRYEDKLDMAPESVSRREYAAFEDEYLNCECALGVLEQVIEDLDIEYCAGRF